MNPSLDCRLLLKTNTYLPEIPKYWLDSSCLPEFDESRNVIQSQKIDSQDKVSDSVEIGNGPFTSACYSEDGEMFAVANLDGIYLLGSYTRTCFAAISLASVRRELEVEDPRALVCTDLFIFDRSCLLGALFSDFLVFWDITPSKPSGFDCYAPRLIGSVSSRGLSQYVRERGESPGSVTTLHSGLKDASGLERDRLCSVHGIKVLRRDESSQECPQKAAVIEFVLELQQHLPVLVRAKACRGVGDGAPESSAEWPGKSRELGILLVRPILPDGLLDRASTKYSDSGSACKLISLAVTERSDYRLYSCLLVVGEANILLLLDESRAVISVRAIPNYSKRYHKYLHSCRCQLSKSGDLLVVQYSDRFSVYSLGEISHSVSDQTGRSSEDENSSGTDEDCSQEYLEDLGIESTQYMPRLRIKPLYSYSQVIQKEWITSISIYRERESSYPRPHPRELYGPVSQLYPCGVLAVTAISSNGQSFYYLMKACSNSDRRSYTPSSPNSVCDHFCTDTTGSSMLIWKLELTKLNGIRRVVWQPGDSICLGLQFIERLKNTKLMYDDYFEMSNLNADSLSEIDKSNVFGKVFFLEPRGSNDEMLLWSRLMVDFTAIHRNKEYIEKEDEFDHNDNEENHFGIPRRNQYITSQQIKPPNKTRKHPRLRRL
ncbi:hypothetical protein OJ252_355 [Cryptosporidium canis]|uniref:Minichromosome loss protein Mcl1 middle region domain-containing protein n=1 Tax=Cryptosporidium canis TaxID=195482 RepID=A0ABQ8PB59_9CRYT|nr:hypothetical protein OJ252_355 [Cryptosporidium canis]